MPIWRRMTLPMTLSEYEVISSAINGVTASQTTQHIHCVHIKNKARIFFSIILFSTEILQNLEDLFPSLVRTQMQFHFQQSLRNTINRHFTLMTSCWTKTETLSWMDKAEMFYQVWALCKWGGRNNHRQTHTCFLNRYAKNYSVYHSCGLMMLC